LRAYRKDVNDQNNMKNEFLRHILATIAYRFQKTMKEYNDDFGHFTPGKGSRTALEIIHHIYDVLHKTRVFVQDERYKKDAPARLNLHEETDRFYSELKRLDQILAEKTLDIDFSKRLIQGPLSDILTHLGQLAMLRRLNGQSIAGEDFSSAPIKTGKF